MKGQRVFYHLTKKGYLKNGSMISCDNIKNARKYFMFLIVFSLLPIKILGRYITIAMHKAANNI